MKDYADKKMRLKNWTFILGRAENIVKKGENFGSQDFLFFSTVFSKTFFLRVIKSRDCVVKS